MSKHERFTELDLKQQSELARFLLSQVADIVADDEEVITATIEGETGLLEAIDAALDQISDAEALAEMIAKRIEKLEARKVRMVKRAERLRTAVAVAMEAASAKKLIRPLGTLSLRTLPQKVIVTDEAAIPTRFWVVPKPEPKIDKKALLDALKASDPDTEEAIPGCELSNGGISLTIRTA